MRDRPPHAEAAARAFIFTIAPERFGPAGEGIVPVPVLDQLKASNPAAYWLEIGQLTVQFDMFRQVVQRDTLRARQLAIVFGTEFEARVRQRAWRGASEAECALGGGRHRPRGEPPRLATRSRRQRL